VLQLIYFCDSFFGACDVDIMADGVVIVFDPMLAYIAWARDASNPRNLKRMVLAKFTFDQVKAAKTTLYEKCNDVLGDFPERSKSKSRTADEAHVDDVVEAFVKLEIAGKLPQFAVLAEELHLVPRARPDEIEVFSLVDRISAVEEAVVALKDAVVRRDDRPKSSLRAENDAGGSQSQQPNRRSSRQKDRRLSSIWDDEYNLRPRSSSRGSSTVPKNTEPKTMAEVTSNNADLPFTEVKNRRKNNRKRGQKGTAGNSENLKGGSDTFCVQITNVNPAVTKEDVSNYVSAD